MTEKALLVGCGNMGFAMLKGWMAARPGLEVHVVDPTEALRERAAGVGARVYGAAAELPADLAPDLIFLAVKPQMMGAVLPDYARFAGGPATFLSVAAGTTIATMAAALPGPTPLIRCMPNTPAAIGAGMMVCVGNAHVADDARALASALLACSGEVAWVEDEALIDAVTAVSGSGPAYVFHMIEAMTEAGRRAGLPEDLAVALASQTVYGAGLLAHRSEDDAATLRQQVTSPNGTTFAALQVLMKDGALTELVSEAVAAAKARAIELGEG